MFEWSASRPDRFAHAEKVADTYQIEGCVGQRVSGLNAFETTQSHRPGRE